MKPRQPEKSQKEAYEEEYAASKKGGETFFPETLARDAIMALVVVGAVITLAKDLGIPAQEQAIPRELLYIADEVFFTGTAAEITPIRSIDKITIGAGWRGPITERLQVEFFGITAGEIPDRHGWLTPV